MQKGKLIIFPLVICLTLAISTFTVLADESLNLLPSSENEEEYLEEIPSESEIISIENEHPSDEWNEDDFEDVQPIPMPTPRESEQPTNTNPDPDGEHDNIPNDVPPMPIPTPQDEPPPVTFYNPREDGHGTLPPQDLEDVPPLPMPIPRTEPEPGDGGFVEGSIINPEDLPIEESDDHSGSIVVPPPGTLPPEDHTHPL